MNIFFISSLLAVVAVFFPVGILFALLARKFSESERSLWSYAKVLLFFSLAVIIPFCLSVFFFPLKSYLIILLVGLILVPTIFFYQKEWHLYEKLATIFWGGLVFSALLFLIYNFSVTYPFVINDDGMTPFFQKGDKVFCQINRGQGSYSKEDVVILKTPGNKGKVVIRKVVATEGDRVESSGDKLLINGQVTSQIEPNIFLPPRILGEDELFVLAEKKGALDSSVFGSVKNDDIINKILFKVNWLGE